MACLSHCFASYLWMLTGWFLGVEGKQQQNKHDNFIAFSRSFVKRYKETNRIELFKQFYWFCVHIYFNQCNVEFDSVKLYQGTVSNYE